MRFRLRTLLILLAVLPPMIGGAWWSGPAAAVVLYSLAFIACLAVGGVLCAMGLASIADAVIGPWEKRE